MQFFDRLRRVSTVRRSRADGLESPVECASPTSPVPSSSRTSSRNTSPAPIHDRLLRKLRRAASPAGSERTATGARRTPADDSIRRATSERTSKAISLASATSPSKPPTSMNPSRSSLPDAARRPVYRRASASVPALTAVLPFPEASGSGSSRADPMLDTLLAAGLESATLRTCPAAHTFVVHQHEQFVECAVDVEVWPASAPASIMHQSMEAVVVEHVTTQPARLNSVTRSALSGSSSRSGARSRTTRARAPRVRAISVESAKRHATRRRWNVSTKPRRGRTWVPRRRTPVRRSGKPRRRPAPVASAA